jgi:hypothetical protein
LIKSITNPPKPKEEEAFYCMLMLLDRMSARQFLLSWVDPSYIVCSNVLTLSRRKKNPGGIPDGPEYNYSTIESIETATL